MIEIKNLNKYFNKHKKNELHVINNVTLNLKDSGLVALLGPSGSGKTTLLNAIGGLDKVNSGSIFINNKKITSKSVHKKDEIRNIDIGYIFQDYKLIDNLSVFDNIALVLKMIGIKDKKEIKTRVDYVLNAVNMYRYRNRPAGMLSGGERQRVGIARAIVKDPQIIIADEPTGNLDSKNSIETMNIIKAISKNRLVILVTHERELAMFYASRIIEIKDGTIQNDYENEVPDELDYRMESNIYLKDLKEHDIIRNDDIKINYYSEEKENLELQIVVKNGNIYIKSKENKKIEVIDEHSNIELLDKHYEKIDKSIYQEYEFNFDKAINKNIRKKYSSIFNPISLIINGFKKVFDFPVLKKILLGGFFISAMFIVYSISSISGTLNIQDKDFVTINRNYLSATTGKISVDEYLKYEKSENIEYVLPGTSKVSFNVKYNDLYQTSQVIDTLQGSLSSIDMLKNEDLIMGKMPENEYEIVVDKMSIDKMFENDYAKMSGVKEIKDMLNREIYVDNMKNFKIVGIVDKQSPSIYTSKNMFINILTNTNKSDENSRFLRMQATEEANNASEDVLEDYKLLQEQVELKEGRFPENDYEVMVNINRKDEMPLNKEIETKVNDVKLKVVGFYESKDNLSVFLVNNNTLKIKLIGESSEITIYAKNKDEVMNEFKNVYIVDSYTKSKDEYMKEIKENITSSVTVAGIILAISLIEIYLMIRSSFLSRIQEIGIYRAIGVKRADIYKMFLGEILAITTIAGLPGLLFMSYIIKVISTIKYLENYFLLNGIVFAGEIIFMYAFNILVGLIPVFNTIRKTPAQILSRNDI